jgi:hypothetical protein
MTTATVPVVPRGTAARNGPVFEGALRLARQADLQPASVRRRFRIIGGVTLAGVATVGVVKGTALLVGSPPSDALRLLLGFVALSGVGLTVAGGIAATMLVWSVHHYQRLLLLDATASTAEATEELERRRQRIAAFLRAVEHAAPDTLAREVDALRRDMEAMDDLEHSKPDPGQTR